MRGNSEWKGIIEVEADGSPVSAFAPQIAQPTLTHTNMLMHTFVHMQVHTYTHRQ